MSDQDTARTIIFDLVKLDRLGAELERRFRLDQSVQAVDLLSHIDPADHPLYLPQLIKLREGLVKLAAEGKLAPLEPGSDHSGDVGDDLHRSLMATAITASSNPSDSGPGGGAAAVLSGAADRKGSESKPSASDGSGAVAGSDAVKGAVPERIDQFRIIRELGAGAFGVVYLAEDESLQRKVAIKVPKVSDPARSASYINEARKAAAIDCKGIVPIFHVGMKENGVPFVVQKLIDGPSLRLLLTRYGSLPPAHAVTLMRDIAIALSSAHYLGIYHRDLKPDNVLIDANGVPWIADFGLAISESEQAKRKGEVAGTLMYMSPEQIQGRADWLDGRSDIWALGIMLHELLLGKPPFSGRNQQALMEQICHREPRPLQQTSPALAALNDVFVKCCAKSPSNRYASAEELARELTHLINEGLPTQPIDGSELQLDKPISQYDSEAVRATRSRAGESTIGGFAASTRAGGATATHLSNAHPATTRSASAPLSATSQIGSSTQPASAATKATNWTLILIVGIGVASLLSLTIQQWIQRHPAASDAVVSVPPAPDTQDEPDAESGLQRVEEKSPGVDPIAETSQLITNALSASEANGSEKLPWIVAGDGSGSHRTIAAALADSEPDAYIHLKPGTYNESLKLMRPIHLVGIGKAENCVIASATNTPIEIACGLGLVSIENISVTGSGLVTGKEFNAILVTNGKLRLAGCWIRSSTFNGVKLLDGSSLDAEDNRFIESRAFAISARNHVGLKVIGCEFFQSGVQAIGGPANLLQCHFKGTDGLEVSQNGETPAAIVDCDFIECLGTGALSTDNGSMDVFKSRFTGCKIGASVYNSKGSFRECVFSSCSSAAIYVTEGDATIFEGTDIRKGIRVGVMIEGGSVQIRDSEISELVGSGVYAKGNVDLQLSNTNISKCGMFAISLHEGNVTINGGTMRECDVAISMVDLAQHATVIGTKFIDNRGSAIDLLAGELDCEDIAVAGSEIALLAQSEAEKMVFVTLTRATFSRISDVVADLEGMIHLTVRESVFEGIEDENRYRKRGGAEVSEIP